MQFFSQKDPRWKNDTIGSTKLTINDFGCLIICWAMILGVEPPEIAKQPVFDSDGLLVRPSDLASLYGAEYNTTRSIALYDPVICEVRIGSQQHFVIRYQDRIYDPYTLDGKPYKNYTILSYRNLKGAGVDYKKLYEDTERARITLLEQFNTCKANLTLNENAVKELKKKLGELDTKFDAYREDSADKIARLTKELKETKEKAVADLLVKQKKIDQLEQAIKDSDLSKLSFWEKIIILFS